MTPTHCRNRLADQTSPYLLQHADNPVDWYPWGKEALDRARREDKIILLSVGYSACHWCHVMAHESFEDPETARVMNELYVNIKVDREERPDLDRIYQTAHQLLARRPGGWPLTMFLTPDGQTPVFGGTYFPRTPRHGLPAFVDLLHRVEEYFRSHRQELEQQNRSLLDAMASIGAAGDHGSARLHPRPLQEAEEQLRQSYDQEYGGFGGAPKFPHPSNIELLMRRSAAAPESGAESRRMALETLRRMAEGGINDQLGGGFCRYSVDQQWLIPHFEKMLYDNAQLLPLYAQASQLGGEALLADTARGIADWVMREMQAPQGGYYSALDADSEGEEGRYYVWDREQTRSLLDPETYRVVAAHWGLDRPANFEGHWHLHVARDASALARKLGRSQAEVQTLIDAARTRLLAAREKRVRPGLDDKVLTAWNGLMIRGMSIAGRILGREDYLESACRALDYLRQTHWRDGRLLATSKDGQAHLMAYLDDHAFLLDGVLELLQSRWRDGDLDFAVTLAELLLERFEDPDGGGFYFTAHDHESLIQRPRSFSDEAIPAGNGIAAQALARLGHLLGEQRYLTAAQRVLEAAWHGITQTPYAHASLLVALEEHLVPPETVVLRAGPAVLPQWQRRCQDEYVPGRMVLGIPQDAAGLTGMLAERSPRGEAVAYVCRGLECLAPITGLRALEEQLGRVSQREAS